jgi:hypothetical protein
MDYEIETLNHRRMLANHCADHFTAMSSRQVRLISGQGTRARLNDTPLHTGTLVLLYADVDKLQALAKIHPLSYLRG